MPYKGRIRTSAIVQQRARALRQRMTPAEEKLWQYLRGKRLNGLKFRRQHPLEPFIADFYYAEYRLVVEVNGPTHLQRSLEDAERTAQFEAFDYHVMPFKNEEILNNIDEVLRKIQVVCNRGAKTSPLAPLPASGEGNE
jgi:very-short-patch-repair endonuclease